MLKYVCKICGKEFKHHIPFSTHLKDVHQLTNKTYYDTNIKRENEGKCAICNKETAFINFTKGYRECCSTSCANTLRAKNSNGADVTCAICNEKLHTTGTVAHVYTKLFYHINTKHGITNQKEYYDEYIKQENQGICPICGKETEFRSIALGYNTYCSSTCSVAAQKLNENGVFATIKNIIKERTMISKMVESIKNKYQKFISSNDKLINYSDIRSEPLERKNVTDKKTFIDPETQKEITVKTEISCTPTKNWLDNQEYKPQLENCNTVRKSNWYTDDINDEQNFSSNEWC